MHVERTVLIANGGRHQSVAEHVYSMITLGNYLYELKLTKLKYKKLIKHILYHDVAEIEMNDTHLFDQDNSIDGKERERKITTHISQNLPIQIREEYVDIANQFLDLNSIEARYASGIDALDPMLLSFNIRENWIGFTEEKIRKHKLHRVEEFPEQLELFELLITGLKDKGFLVQS